VDDWSEGFFDGLLLRHEAWLPLFESGEDSKNILAIALNLRDQEGIPLLRTGMEDTADIVREKAHNLIPPAVIAIDLYWKQRRGQR
jgi:hypothetical protein